MNEEVECKGSGRARGHGVSGSYCGIRHWRELVAESGCNAAVLDMPLISSGLNSGINWSASR
jgi:hypothetical protein